MRKEKAYLPPASGGRVTFDNDAPGVAKASRTRQPSEDISFMGSQIIIALVAAILVGGVAGLLFRPDEAESALVAAKAPHAASERPAAPETAAKTAATAQVMHAVADTRAPAPLNCKPGDESCPAARPVHDRTAKTAR